MLEKCLQKFSSNCNVADDDILNGRGQCAYLFTAFNDIHMLLVSKTVH
jgi:hypothetical protein